MNSECESHIPHAGREREAAGGNCVVARRGGEQPEAEGWSRTRVNSIRHVGRASLLGMGEACRASGESATVQGLPILDACLPGCGWSENDWKGAWDKWRDLSGCQVRGLTGVRASIVAMKPGNAGGAKGRRKTNCTGTKPVKTRRTLPQGLQLVAGNTELGSKSAVENSPVTGR